MYSLFFYGKGYLLFFEEPLMSFNLYSKYLLPVAVYLMYLYMPTLESDSQHDVLTTLTSHRG